MTIESRDQFTERLVRNQHRIYAFIATLVPNRTNAEEIFQEVSLILWRRWQDFDPAADFAPWACGIAFNVVRSHRRKQRNTPMFSDELLAEIADTRMEIDEWLEIRSAALNDCLQSLSEQSQRLIDRCYCGDEKIKTVAEKLGLAASQLYGRLRRLRRDLFECVDRRLNMKVS